MSDGQTGKLVTSLLEPKLTLVFSGLRQVFVDFTGEDAEVNIGNFDAGTNDMVTVTFKASCCIRKATLGLLDVAGNSNRNVFDQGPLTGILISKVMKCLI